MKIERWRGFDTQGSSLDGKAIHSLECMLLQLALTPPMRAANQLEEGQGQYRVTFTAQAKSKVLAQFDRNEDSPHVVSARCKDVNDQDGVCVCVFAWSLEVEKQDQHWLTAYALCVSSDLFFCHNLYN